MVAKIMPLYEYHCGACQKDHEIIQKLNDPPLAICPACGGPIEKKLSLSSFQLKGGGWYKEGYASVSKDRKEKKEERKEGEKAPKPLESKGESKSDTPAKGTEKSTEKK